MTDQTIYCEECVEDIPFNQIYWDEGRLYCKQCGSEVEPPNRDIFEEIAGNQNSLIFREDVDEDLADQEDDEDEDDDLLPDDDDEDDEDAEEDE